MDIAVFIKQVPDVPTIRIDTERMTIIREGVESIINPLDVIALEAALQLRKRMEGKVTVLTMGPPQSEEALREALAFGADEVVLLSDPAFAGADTLATSHVLARAVSRLERFPDLILCGRHTIDSDTGHVGPQVAEELDIPQVCGVSEIHHEGASLVVKQVNEGLIHTFRVNMPALLTVSQELILPHHIPLADVEQAFTNRNILRWSLEDLGLSPDEVGLHGSATRVLKLYKPPLRRKGVVFTGSAHDLVDDLMEKLEALSILDEEPTGE